MFRFLKLIFAGLVLICLIFIMLANSFFRVPHFHTIRTLMLNLTDIQKIGLVLLFMGLAFFGLGMMLLFDTGLLALGNILFIFGLGLFIGTDRVLRFFFQRHKLKGTSFFFGGILIVLFGFPLIGTVAELYGSFCLFGGFMPVAIHFLYNVPIIGWILYLPGINKVAVALSGQSKSMV